MPLGDTALPPRLVLYDGICGFCDRAVQRLLDLDRDGRLRFASLQGETASAIRERHSEIPADLDSIVYVELQDGTERVFWHAEAVLRICEALQLSSPWLTLARRLPRWLSGIGYRIFASQRYRFFGKLEQCRIPSPEQRAFFLD